MTARHLTSAGRLTPDLGISSHDVATLVHKALAGRDTDTALAEVVTEMAVDVLRVARPADAGPSGSLGDYAQAVLTEAAATAASPVFAPDPLAELDPEPLPETSLDPATEARLAAARSSIVIRAVDTNADVAAAVAVLDAVFDPDSSGHYYPPSLLRNILAAGAPILLAYDVRDVVGVIIALPGWGEHGPIVQSGPLGVLPAARGRGVALALKFAQRAWCLERGIRELHWSFDVMARASARLNFHTLRAEAVSFLPGFEGVRTAGAAPALPHDRLLVRWNLDGAPPARRVNPRKVVRVSHAVRDASGRPEVDPSWRLADVALVAVPANIAKLRQEDPVLAAAWQQAVGLVLREGLEAGWAVDVDSASRYRLTAPGLALVPNQ